VVETNNVT